MRRNPHVGGQQLPLIAPLSTWTPPAALPDLRRLAGVAGPGGMVGLDIETRDEGLARDMGSFWPRGPGRDTGHICGVSAAWGPPGVEEAFYAPVRHPEGECMDPGMVRQWVVDHAAAGVRFVTQGGLYDWGWLGAEWGIRMPDVVDEVGALATLVDENRFEYNLDALCRWRGVRGKDEEKLREAAAAFGFEGRVKENLWRLPARYVGPYAEADALSTLQVWRDMEPVLDAEGTREAYRLECDLLPMVLEMRRRGIRLDGDRAVREKSALLAARDAVFANLAERLGERVGMEEVGRTRWLERTFAKHAPEVHVPRTAPTKNFPTGQASFAAGITGWMHKNGHWLCRGIVRADKLNNAATKFIQRYLLDAAHRGRIHAEIHPHRSDEGGTRSMRFSYSDPPLQQMTAHDSEIAPAVRGCLLPEEEQVWASPDQSQQEFRMIVHFAALLECRGADLAVARYRDDPDTDFHQYVSDVCSMTRAGAKNVNFAKAFGAGKPKFAAMINKSEEEAGDIYDQYDRDLPFVSELAQRCEAAAARRGYVRLLDGARRHWNLWAPKWVDFAERDRGHREGYRQDPCSLAEAQERTRVAGHPWRGKALRRHDTRKAMNGLIQGSAARQTKLWMRALWREGICPMLQMHDALDTSVSNQSEGERIAQIGRDVVRLLVPVKVDIKYGRSWGDAKHKWEDLT